VLLYPDLEGSEVADLRQLAALVEPLGSWRRRLAVPRSLAGWRSVVNALLVACFAPDDEEEALLQLVRDGLDEAATLAETVGFDRPVGLDVLRALVRELMDDDRGAHRFLTGRVNFCMVPMRSIPFRVVRLIGMNGTDFPRTQRPLSFDLMARHPRRGDRSRRRDDRYLFLEALLSARDVLYLMLGRKRRARQQPQDTLCGDRRAARLSAPGLPAPRRYGPGRTAGRTPPLTALQPPLFRPGRLTPVQLCPDLAGGGPDPG